MGHLDATGALLVLAGLAGLAGWLALVRAGSPWTARLWGVPMHAEVYLPPVDPGLASALDFQARAGTVHHLGGGALLVRGFLTSQMLPGRRPGRFGFLTLVVRLSPGGGPPRVRALAPAPSGLLAIFGAAMLIAPERWLVLGALGAMLTTLPAALFYAREARVLSWAVLEPLRDVIRQRLGVR